MNNSSAKYYQNKKKSFKKEFVKGVKIFLKTMVASNIKNFPNMKNKGWWSIEEKLHNNIYTNIKISSKDVRLISDFISSSDHKRRLFVSMCL